MWGKFTMASYCELACSSVCCCRQYRSFSIAQSFMSVCVYVWWRSALHDSTLKRAVRERCVMVRIDFYACLWPIKTNCSYIFAWRRVCLHSETQNARPPMVGAPHHACTAAHSEAIARGSVCSECWPSCINVVFCACMNNGRFKRCAASLHCNTIVHRCRSVETTNIRLCRKRAYCN